MLTTFVHGDKIIPAACISLSILPALYFITFLPASLTYRHLAHTTCRYSLLLESQLDFKAKIFSYALGQYNASAAASTWRCPLGFCVKACSPAGSTILRRDENCRRWGLNQEVSHWGSVLVVLCLIPRPFLSSHCFLSAPTWASCFCSHGVLFMVGPK